MVHRNLQKYIESWLFRKKTIILYGARQVGKTTLARNILKAHGNESAYYNCEVPSIKQLLETKEPTQLKREFGEERIIVLDEAQYVPEIGQILKIISDHLPELQVIATGSSSFELAQQTSEPLTGRALSFTLYPLSYEELLTQYKPSQIKAQLENWLLYGSYPEIALASVKDARLLLDDLTSRYLYKDLFIFENLKRSDIIHKLLQLLAFQVGSEVSDHELAVTLKVNQRTVAHYIDLLEKSFVIFCLPAFSRNLRKEIGKKRKIYFYDVGVRNSIIQHYQPLKQRNDLGALWENYLVVERQKYLQERQLNRRGHFWRTYDRQEIDYIEEYDGMLHAYELKWKTKRKKIPPAFNQAYPNSEFQWIDHSNFETFIAEGRR